MPKAPVEPHPDMAAFDWKPLFKSDLSNATFKPGAWKMLPDGTSVPGWHRGFPALSTIPSKGRIGFQGVHGDAGVSVRNLRIAALK